MMSLNADLIRTIYKTLGEMIVGNRNIKEILTRYREACLSQDLDRMNLEVEVLRDAFVHVGNLSTENQQLLSSIGLSGPSPYEQLLGVLSGATKASFQARVVTFLHEVKETREDLIQQESMLGAQVAILGDVVGEMQLEISV